MTNKYERIKKLVSVLQNNLCRKQIQVTDIMYAHTDYKTNNDLPDKSALVPFNDGIWGGAPDDHYWFRAEVDVESVPDCTAELLVTTGYDGWNECNPQVVCYVDGIMTQALDRFHTTMNIDAGHHVLYFYAYTGMRLTLKLDFKLTLRYVDKYAERLYYDLVVPTEALDFMQENEKPYFDTIDYLNKALCLVDFMNAGNPTFFDTCKVAANYFEHEFYDTYCKIGDTKVACVGHTHIDIAWLWSVRQTREKAQRSFATVLHLMDKYPDYKFTSSQCYLYKAVKEENPELYERIKQRIAEGRWEVEGAMWVEADCNLISGESFVRQILYGKRFMRDEFGVDSKVLWLPDVFGYSAALPQILKLSGVDTFVTSKIGWNDTNMIPHDLFDWQGVDGSKVFTYFLTAQNAHRDGHIDRYSTYNAEANPSQVIGSYNRMQQNDITDEVVLTYGYGDGGGGPTSWHIEYIRRMAKGIPCVPATRFSNVAEFVSDVKQNVKKAGRLPKWTGELYLEFHRGTYTSIAKNKRNNRKAEYLMQNLELLSVLADKLRGVAVPQTWLTEHWQTMLTNQFHDIIPGSSITEVYDLTDKEYAELFDSGNELLRERINAVVGNSNDSLSAESVTVFNPNGFAVDGYVCVDGKYAYVKNVPGKGFGTRRIIAPKSGVKTTEYTLENKYFRIKFDREYNIARIYDKRSKRNVLKGKAEYVAYEDYPICFDAWELRDYYTEKTYPVQFVSVVDVDFGGKKGKRIVKRVGDSTITTDVCLYELSDRIDFDTTLNWQNNNVLLKAVFPVDVNATTATCDIQFGNVQRPTVCNTSWDKAKFEFCAHKYVDVSEGDYGVALMSDCKYGYSARDNVVTVSLVKCTTYPNDSVDKGAHKFTYALYPHVGDVAHSKVMQQAMLLNNPLVAVGGKTEDISFVAVDCDSIVIDTVKPAEDGNGVVLRLFENNNCTTNCTLTFGLNVTSATICDLLENDLRSVAVANNKIKLTLKPFEIVSIKVQL